MKYCFTTLGCPNWTLEHIAEEAARMGFDGVELRTSEEGNHIKPDAAKVECDRIQALFKSCKVSIACLMGYTNFATADAAVREKSEATCRSLIQTAANLGCPTIRIFGGDPKTPDLTDAIERVVGSLKKLAPLAEAVKVKLAIETHDAWCRHQPLLKVLAKVASPAVGICWDYSNMAGRVSIEEAWANLRRHVVHIHAKDITGVSDQAVLIGQGIARAADALAMVQASDYQGWISCEWEKKWQPALPEPEVAFPHWLKFAKSFETKVRSKPAGS